MIATMEQVAVVKGIIFHNEKMLIVKRSDDDEFGAGTWEFAGGKIEFEEDLETALVREAKEEVGLDITVDKLLCATSFFTCPERKVILLTYICTSQTEEVVISNEHSDYKWITPVELHHYLPSAIISDLEKNHFLK